MACVRIVRQAFATQSRALIFADPPLIIDTWTRRRHGAGAMLLLLLVVAFAWPFWNWRMRSHPLMGADRVDLCAALQGIPALASLHTRSYYPTDGAGACAWTDNRGVEQLDIALYTVQTMNTRYNPPQKIERYFDHWLESLRGRLRNVVQSGEPGERTLRYTLHPRIDVVSRQAMIEDHGTLMWVSSNTMGAAEFEPLAGALQSALRRD